MSIFSQYSERYPDIVANLVNARRTGRLAHAFLISSVSEKIRNEFATVVAEIAGCPEFDRLGRIDEYCSCCSKLEQQIYPELHTLTPVGKKYQIQVGKRDNPEPNTVRDFINSFHFSSWNNSWRKIGIIYDCDRMGKEAQNAFLKTLEEPPPDTTLILVTGNPGSLLPTTRSRCQTINIPATGMQYDFKGVDTVLKTLYKLCFEKCSIADAEEAAEDLKNTASLLLENAKQLEYSKFEQNIAVARQMEDAGMVKRLEERLENIVNGSYMRERRSFLSAISAFCFQVFMLSSGVEASDLPNRELFGNQNIPKISPERGQLILSEAETLVSTLNFQVSEELAFRTFAMNIAVN